MIRDKILATLSLTVVWMIPIAGLFFTPVARADSLSSAETAYVQTYGPGDICPALDGDHTIDGVITVTAAAMSYGFTATEAVSIVNTSVDTYCRRNWPLLEQAGAYFRAADRRRV